MCRHRPTKEHVENRHILRFFQVRLKNIFLSKSKKNFGLYRSGMVQSGAYEQAKPIIEQRSPLFQILYAVDARVNNTYEQTSRLVPIRKCRIIQETDLKKQEYFFEKTAHEKNLMENK